MFTRRRVLASTAGIGAVAFLGRYQALYDGAPVSWCMWNEPSHNLTGSANLTSVSEMTDIYDAYTSAIAPHGLFGMASFIPPNAVVSKELGGRMYIGAVIDELRQRGPACHSTTSR